CRECYTAGRSYNPALSLELPIPTPARQGVTCVSLEDCLALYTKPEVLRMDCMVTCPECKRKRETTKQLSVWSPPKLLIITLKRFKAFGNFADKITCDVAFQPGLDMAPYCFGGGAMDKRPGGSGPLWYDLVGVVNHSGNLHGGHYTADARGAVDKQWHY